MANYASVMEWLLEVQKAARLTVEEIKFTALTEPGSGECCHYFENSKEQHRNMQGLIRKTSVLFVFRRVTSVLLTVLFSASELARCDPRKQTAGRISLGDVQGSFGKVSAFLGLLQIRRAL